jgi:hypothetical protein
VRRCILRVSASKERKRVQGPAPTFPAPHLTSGCSSPHPPPRLTELTCMPSALAAARTHCPCRFREKCGDCLGARNHKFSLSFREIKNPWLPKHPSLRQPSQPLTLPTRTCQLLGHSPIASTRLVLCCLRSSSTPASAWRPNTHIFNRHE